MASQVQINKKHRVIENVPTPDGMLYEGEIVIATDMDNNKVRVTDDLGRIYHIDPRKLELIV